MRPGAPSATTVTRVALVVVLAPEPAPDFFIVDRFLGAAELANIAALIVRNKADLHLPGEHDAELANYAAIGYPIVVVSAQRNQGIAQLAEHLRGQRSVLVGRPSVSRGIHPQVDCGADTGVSRRHCQLSTDGQRWWVEDLQSSNGTYVSPAGEALPTDPIPPGQRRELGDGDRLYLGAWTRLVVRKALPGEA